jgi:hypothetical protein
VSFDTTIWGKTSEIYKTSSTKRHMLGTRLVLPDGRVYRYAKCGGTALTIGRVCGAIAHNTGLDSDVKVTEARTTAQWDDGDLTIRILTTGSASDTSFNLTSDMYTDGYIWVNDEAGEGQILQIKEHGAETATGSTAGIDITCYEEEVLTIALTTASQVGLLRNIYDGVRIHAAGVGAGPAIGVAPIAVSASQYFWMQTWGPCPVRGGNIAALAGDHVGVLNTTGATDTGVPGSFYKVDDTGHYDTPALASVAPRIGYVLQVASADDEYALIYLTIAP